MFDRQRDRLSLSHDIDKRKVTLLCTIKNLVISQVLPQQGIGVKCHNDPGFLEQVDITGLGYALVDRVLPLFQDPFKKNWRAGVYSTDREMLMPSGSVKTVSVQLQLIQVLHSERKIVCRKSGILHGPASLHLTSPMPLFYTTKSV